jgi:CheY-like chemotaxis protein
LVVNRLDRPLRFLLVGGVDGEEATTRARLQAAGSPDVEVERTPTAADALQRLDAQPLVDVALLDPEVADMTVPEAFAAIHARAADVPVVVLTRVEGDHLALAVAAVTRSPQSASATARRIAALLPKYLEHRERDFATLGDALEREDYEVVARIGHNLRGNGVSFCIPELSAIGERIEAAARLCSPSDAREPIDELRACLDGILGRGRVTGKGPRRTASGTRVRTIPPDGARLADKKP